MLKNPENGGGGCARRWFGSRSRPAGSDPLPCSMQCAEFGASSSFQITCASSPPTDSALPIGYEQTISQPYIVAFMTELLDVERHHRVLEIGTGSGYQTAVLATLSDHVYSMEIVPELAVRARQILGSLGYEHPFIRHGDGYEGWPEHAPYDRIIVTAAPPEVPEKLLEQLAPAGQLVAPVGSTPDTQSLVLVSKDSDGRLSRQQHLGVRFVPMVQAADQN